MTDDPKRPDRSVRSSEGHETIEYRFAVEIFVRQPPLDEKRVRELIDAELARLGTAIKNAR
ncbi:MAG TPA: hypothetical protein VGD80_39415 [Kofleriaceae bacterium]